MAPASRLELLPHEILNNIFLYLTSGKSSNHLATGMIDDSFRPLIFTCPRISSLASVYYYSRAIFICNADDLVWETIRVNPDPQAVQAFSHCMTRIQHLEVKIKFFGVDEKSVKPDKLSLLNNLERIDIQIADLDSLRCYLERCKLLNDAAPLKLLVLASRNPAHARYVVTIATNYNGLIREKDMYLAVFKSFEQRKCVVSMRHGLPADLVYEIHKQRRNEPSLPWRIYDHVH